MGSDRDVFGATGGHSWDYFAGDLFLHLANQGWLVVEPDEAERVIADLRQTLEVVQDRVHRLQRTAEHEVLPGLAGQPVTSSQLETALVELPKYIEAFRIAGARGG